MSLAYIIPRRERLKHLILFLLLGSCGVMIRTLFLGSGTAYDMETSSLWKQPSDAHVTASNNVSTAGKTGSGGGAILSSDDSRVSESEPTPGIRITGVNNQTKINKQPDVDTKLQEAGHHIVDTVAERADAVKKENGEDKTTNDNEVINIKTELHQNGHQLEDASADGKEETHTGIQTNVDTPSAGANGELEEARKQPVDTGDGLAVASNDVESRAPSAVEQPSMAIADGGAGDEQGHDENRDAGQIEESSDAVAVTDDEQPGMDTEDDDVDEEWEEDIYEEDEEEEGETADDAEEELTETSDELSGSEAGERRQRRIRRLPQVLVIGVKKCGTATLKSFLGLNDYIQPTQQEQHFFDRHYEEGDAYYISRMSPAYDHQLTLEGSPRYFVSEETPERVRAMNASMKLLVIVRNPVTRLISDYVHTRGLRVHIRPSGRIRGKYGNFDSHVFTDDGLVNTDYEPVTTGIYVQHLRRWLDVFPRSQIHVVDGDRFVTEPWVELQAIEKFLGVPSMITQENFIPHPSKKFFCKRKQDDEMKCMDDRKKGREHPDVASIGIVKLKAFYRLYNEELFELTGRTFDWN